jgi:hypothetical protein
MAPQTLAPGQGKRAGREPLFDVHPQTGATIGVFYTDRTLETFGGAALVGSGGLLSQLSARRTGHWSVLYEYAAYRDGMKSSG